MLLYVKLTRKMNYNNPCLTLHEVFNRGDKRIMEGYALKSPEGYLQTEFISSTEEGCQEKICKWNFEENGANLIWEQFEICGWKVVKVNIEEL